MGLTELRTEHTVPEWTVGFLRARSTALQRALVAPHRVLSLSEEEDSIYCWGLVLLAATDLPGPAQAALDELHLLHARVDERLERGGVADISEEVEFLIRTVLVDRLQRLTDAAVHAIDD